MPLKSKLSPIGFLQGKKLIPFSWYGGKFSHSGQLIPLLPEYRRCCESFADFGAILLNREPSPVEICNDLNREAVNFFRVLRGKKEKLIKVVSFNLEGFSTLEKLQLLKINRNLKAQIIR